MARKRLFLFADLTLNPEIDIMQEFTTDSGWDMGFRINGNNGVRFRTLK
jgi:hypothetical protein